MKKTNLEAKFTKSSENFSKLNGKAQKLKQKTQGPGGFSHDWVPSDVIKKPALQESKFGWAC